MQRKIARCVATCRFVTWHNVRKSSLRLESLTFFFFFFFDPSHNSGIQIKCNPSSLQTGAYTTPGRLFLDPICASRTEGPFNYITQRAFRPLTLSKKNPQKTKKPILPSPILRSLCVWILNIPTENCSSVTKPATLLRHFERETCLMRFSFRSHRRSDVVCVQTGRDECYRIPHVSTLTLVMRRVVMTFHNPINFI